MTNLLHETREAIVRSGHRVEDVVFIGSRDGKYACSWDEFCHIADREYDSGFGGAEVASDLIVCFTDGRKMWRGEYDGSEWWEFDEIDPNFDPSEALPISRVIGRLWPNVASLNGKDA